MVTMEISEGFKINQILECGQCFRFKQLDAMFYEIYALSRRLRVKQEGNRVVFDCSQEDYDQLWHSYFDMNRDYPALMERLIRKDQYLKEAVTSKSGLRVLQQEPFEMLLGFIISQNKSIPQIKVLIERLCQTYGSQRTDVYGTYYCFPTPEQLKEVTEEDFRALKVGFRAPYLLDAVRSVNEGQLDLEAIFNMERDVARDQLMTVKGIGRKVADCILLFAYGKANVFPVDVWVRRIVTESYFKGEKVSDRQILAFADDYFEGVSGLAQQYLFYHGRDKALNT